MSKYDDIDNEILYEITQTRSVTYSDLHESLRTALACCLIYLDDKYNTTRMLLDKRLQALRKRGVIEFDRENRVWRMICPK